MHFRDMPYRRVTYGEIEAEYEALFRDVQAVSCEEDCLRVLKRQYRLGDAMTPIDLCYVRHGMDVNDPFYAQEQAYYDEIGPKIADLSNRFDRLLHPVLRLPCPLHLRQLRRHQRKRLHHEPRGRARLLLLPQAP